MNAILAAALTSAVVATILFVFFWIGKRWIKNPGLLHLLWLVVLAKLLTPAIWSIPLPWLPAEATIATFEPVNEPLANDVPATLDATVSPLETISAPPESNPWPIAAPPTPTPLPATPQISSTPLPASQSAVSIAETITLTSLLFTIWLTGSAIWLSTALLRILRFRWWLKQASASSPDLQARAQHLAKHLKLSSCPRIAVVPGQVSPLLWWFGGRSQIVLPDALLERLDGPSQDTLLLHELAHYARRDHWVRAAELLALAAYWWLPTVWLLRRELRAAEEQACDAWVVAHLPEQRRTYATMLVTTLELLSSRRQPLLATGIGQPHHLERRITMIMQSTAPFRAGRNSLVFFAVITCLLLPFAPALVRGQTRDTTAQPPAPAASTTSPQPVPPSAADKSTDNNAVANDITISVVTDDNKPLANAKLTASFINSLSTETYTSDDKGQFKVPANWTQKYPNDLMQILYRDDTRIGWLRLRQPVKETSLRIEVLPLTSKITGTFVDSEGPALAGVRVELVSLSRLDQGISAQGKLEELLPTVETDDAGKFSLSVPDKVSASFTATHPDFQKTMFSVKAEEHDLGRTILSRGGRIEGQIVDDATGQAATLHNSCRISACQPLVDQKQHRANFVLGKI